MMNYTMDDEDRKALEEISNRVKEGWLSKEEGDMAKRFVTQTCNDDFDSVEVMAYMIMSTAMGLLLQHRNMKKQFDEAEGAAAEFGQLLWDMRMSLGMKNVKRALERMMP